MVLIVVESIPDPHSLDPQRDRVYVFHGPFTDQEGAKQFCLEAQAAHPDRNYGARPLVAPEKR